MKSNGILPLKDMKSKLNSTQLKLNAKRKNIRFLILLLLTGSLFLIDEGIASKGETQFHAYVVPQSMTTVHAPDDGVLTLIHVEVGERVREGDFLGWFYSNKKNRMIKADREGVVGGIHVEKNASIKKDDPILTISNPENLSVISKIDSESDSIGPGQKVYDAISGELFGTVQRAVFDRGKIEIAIQPIRQEQMRLGFVHFLKL